jgi:hypothetical protein
MEGKQTLTRKQRTIAWVFSVLLTLYFALFGTFYGWVISLWPTAGPTQNHGHMVWGIGILWFAFAGCLFGLILDFTKEKREG